MSDEIIPMMDASAERIDLSHDKVTWYLRMLLETYFATQSIGQVVGLPFPMQMETQTYHPDLQVILSVSTERLTNTHVNGASDIVIEIVSHGSIPRDHGTKFAEYERVGIPEYWIIDPIHSECRFYQLENGVFRKRFENEGGFYLTDKLPNFRLHVPTLWLTKLPSPAEIVEAVNQMVKSEG